MVQRHTIPHLKALIVDNNIPGGQGRGSIIGLPSPFLLKSSICHKEWAWQANMNANPQSSRFKKPTIIPFKWGIACFFTILGSLQNWWNPKSVFEVCHSMRSQLYLMSKTLWCCLQVITIKIDCKQFLNQRSNMAMAKSSCDSRFHNRASRYHKMRWLKYI